MPISLDVLQKYADRANVFIETGTHIGATVKLALRLNFKHIYSIELSDKWYAHNAKQFANRNNVTMIHGDSGDKLRELLEQIDEPCLIWLDAHCSGGDTAGKGMLPIYKELAAIKDHPVKNHTVLIDDMRGFGQKVVNGVMDINPDYKISYEDGKRGNMFFKDDILVAQVD